MEDSVVCTHFNIRLIGRKEIQNRFEIKVVFAKITFLHSVIFI